MIVEDYNVGKQPIVPNVFFLSTNAAQEFTEACAILSPIYGDKCYGLITTLEDQP